MAESGTGIIFTQSGVPVQGSADYQRVFDSRWRFMEIELEREFTVNLPALPAVGEAAHYHDDTIVIKHGLGFVPMFETNFPDQRYIYTVLSPASIFCDAQNLFIRRLVTTQGAEAQTLTFKVRIYNLPVLTDYTAPKGLPQGTSSPRSNIGVKFLDGQTAGVDVGDNAVKGFSVDTTKKILSIHKHGLAKINDYSYRYCFTNSVDTTTNTFTVYPSASATSLRARDLSWIKKAGTPVVYFPADHTTFPGGMPTSIGVSDTMYIIPVDDTHFKVALSYENALAGVEIDITSAGSMPGQFSMTSLPGDNSDAILHEVGYPPTFLMALVDNEKIVNGTVVEVPLYIKPMVDIILARVTADTRYIRFGGIQALFSGWYGYVILKDPAELAQ